MALSPSITGSNYNGCRSFNPTTSTSSSTEASIVAGSYAVYAAGVGCWVKTGVTGVTVAVPAATQPASANSITYVAAESWQLLDVTGTAQFIVTITEAGSGTLKIIGPLSNSVNR